MKSTPAARRTSVALASTAVLLLAGAPRCSQARQLRRSSSAEAEAAAHAIVEDEEGFAVVSSNDGRILREGKHGFDVVGRPLEHDSFNRDFWRRSMVHMEEEEGQEQEQEQQEEEEEEEEMEGEMEEEVDAVPKEYINDESLFFVDPEESQHQRIERKCGSDELLWTFQFRTDQYGYETSWKLEKRKQNGDWQVITSGPPANRKYGDDTVYNGAVCLPGAHMYKLTMMDQNKDGFCCSYGKGYYSYTVGGMPIFDSEKKKTFTKEGVKSFYVGLPVPKGNGNGGSIGNIGNGTPFAGRASACGNGRQEIKFKFKADRYGAENTWELRDVDRNEVINRKGLNSYGDGSTDEVSMCVPYGKYRFTLTDGVGDGICCQQGDGRYELYMDDELMVYGSDWNTGKVVEHDIVVGYHARYGQMTSREVQYLNCHNWRRNKYHRQFGGTYVPLKYDLSLGRAAEKWANELLGDCTVHGIDHEPGETQGENLAKNTGSGKWGQLYPVENICRRWFEREETWKWPDNAHFTQGLWRSARYVGCAESVKSMPNGGKCRIQVCRYARAGNCNMGGHKASVGDNWKVPMMADHNPCGPACPPNGCH